VNIVLIGLPGSGKTTVGRNLARLLGMGFVDSDARIELEIGCSIRSWFEAHGEASFRDLETDVLRSLLSAWDGIVLATGGGIVLRDANRSLLAAQPRVVYLHARPEQLARRLKHDTQRPLLQGGDALEKLRQLYEVRDPLYREVAKQVIETHRTSVHALVNLVRMQLDLAVGPADDVSPPGPPSAHQADI